MTGRPPTPPQRPLRPVLPAGLAQNQRFPPPGVRPSPPPGTVRPPTAGTMVPPPMTLRPTTPVGSFLPPAGIRPPASTAMTRPRVHPHTVDVRGGTPAGFMPMPLRPRPPISPPRLLGPHPGPLPASGSVACFTYNYTCSSMFHCSGALSN